MFAFQKKTSVLMMYLGSVPIFPKTLFTAVWYTWYGCVGVWVCVLWWDERYDGLEMEVQMFFNWAFRLADPV